METNETDIKENSKQKHPRFSDFIGKSSYNAQMSGIKTVSMAELYEKEFEETPQTVTGLLSTGLYLLCGGSKYGKSFLVAQLGYCVATGNEFLNMRTEEGKVLYLAFEDTLKRVQERLYKMFGYESSENFLIATEVKTLDDSLEKDIRNFLKANKDTKLIIIDTLQAARGCGKESTYANDYDVIRQLKSIADEYGICMLLVHHTRKQRSTDSFDMINGTTGLMGAADGIIMFEKEKRDSDNAVLRVTGRDIPDTKILIARKKQNLKWCFVESDNELWKPERTELFDRLSEKLSAAGGKFEGTPTELAALTGTAISAKAIGMEIKIRREDLKKGYGIEFETSRNHEGRIIKMRMTDEETVPFRKNFDEALGSFLNRSNQNDSSVNR